VDRRADSRLLTALHDLPQLERLTLTHWTDQAALDACLKQVSATMPKLRFLDLQFTDIPALPDSLRSLEALEEVAV
jgi:hypothetical protein